MKNIVNTLFLVISCLAFSCKTNNGTNNSSTDSGSTSDSLQMLDSTTLNNESQQDIFKGEYLVGDGTYFITRVGDTYEMRNSPGEKAEILYFLGKEKDTIMVYATGSKSVTFKMYPGHRSGIYFETDEKWPVSYLGPLKKEETEEEESERISIQKHVEDSIAFSQLGNYNGEYIINTESEGVDAKLKLMYNGNRTFKYEWHFIVSNEEAHCEGKMKGIVTMDRTQHGFDKQGDCFVHFNFNGFWNEHYVVEIDIEDPAKCLNLKGECNFSGAYTK